MKKISHTQIRKHIAETKTAITDKELFTSSVFTSYLNGITENASGRYGRKSNVVTEWDDRPDAFAAYTDNIDIVINAGNRITQSFRTRKRRADSIVGLNAHEIGHTLYTDFTLLEEYNNSLLAGKMYPNEPRGLSPEDENSLAEIRDLYAVRDETAVRIIARTADKIDNILEDEYVESRMRSEFPGRFKTGMAMNNHRAVKLMPPIDKQIGDGYYGLSILMNMFILYRIKRDITAFGAYEGEYLDTFSECAPYIDNSVYDDDAKIRYDAANIIIIKLWRYIKPLIDNARADMKLLKETLEKIIDRIFKELAGQIVSTGGKPNGNGKPVSRNSDSENSGDGKSEPENGESNETSDDDADETSENGGTEPENGDIDRMLDEIAKDKVCQTLENDLAKELRNEANKINRSGAYSNADVHINHMNPVDKNLITQYNLISPPLLSLSKRLQEQVYPVLKNKRDGGKMTGLYWGKHINSSQIHRNDGRIFCNNRLPEDNPKLAVALLVDESYSMYDQDRITSARDASIIIYDFCVKLGIPVIVYGHSTGNNGIVELYAYSEFESYDGRDIYRMMDMSARNSNHDGAALRFVAERLITRGEETKLLILISDGQPYATGYYGDEAEADLREIKRKYTNKGVTMFAAAIGDDKENIERIYGGGFLDITDLKKLPVNLTSLIARY
ncbi:MAG: nitric oxide reductase activation protein NorD [Oscillospiraceae bacterium]|nr:nitric oxide reductase activation protein NorD [Oscillospiraceae bacterium]